MYYTYIIIQGVKPISRFTHHNIVSSCPKENKILSLLQICKRGIPERHSRRNKLTYSLTQLDTLQDKLLHPQCTQFIFFNRLWLCTTSANCFFLWRLHTEKQSRTRFDQISPHYKGSVPKVASHARLPPLFRPVGGGFEGFERTTFGGQ